MAVRSDPRYFNWALNGKFRNDIDPLMIGVGNFSKLTNLRYVQDGIEGIAGMTKINASATAYTQIDNGFHFKKSQPAEEHILVQTTSGTNSRLVKSDNTADIPSADTFTAYKTLTNANKVMFADAPDSAMIAFDGNTNYIWGGDESRCARFINFADDESFWYDYTEQITNTLQDANNIATIHSQTGLADTYTKLLLHMNGTEGSTTFTDSSPSTQTVTAGADAHITTTSPVFGTGCGIFDGTGDILTVTDSDDFFTDTSNFTIDTRIYFNASVANGLHIICGQYDDANNYWYWGVTTSTTAGVITATFAFYAKIASSVVANYTWADTLAVSTWYHIEVCRTTTTMRFFRNGTQKTKTETVAIGATSMINFGANFVIGGQNGASYWHGKMDEFRFSNGTARHSSTFIVPSTAYSGAGAFCYLGSIRPLDGFKIYVKTANSSASVMTVQEWNGTDWNTLTVTDNTSSSGKSLAATGTVTFTSTASTAKIKVIKGTAAYWYKINWSALAATTQIYYVTVSAPIQAITDIWDGTLSNCMMLTKFMSGDDEFTDYSPNITGEYPYESTLAYTYADLQVETDGAIYAGFLNRQMGLKFTFPDPTNVNEEAGTNATVYYYNGDSFVTVGPIEDNTSTNGISMSTGGTITWQPPEIYNEFPCDKLFGEGSSTKEMSTPTLYWYKIMFDQAVDSDTRCTGVTGIHAPVEIPAHRFGITWQNRLWLFNDQSKNKNSGWCSGYNTNCVFNGSDSGKVLFGNSEEIVCAETIFSRYSGGIYDSLVVFKKNAIYILDGLSIKDYKIYTVANSTGCIAPLTLKKCDIGYEIAPGVSKHIMLFMSARGVDLFDGNSPPVLISKDIGDYFDPNSSNYINLSVVGNFQAFIDERKMEYHLLIATGTSTSLNKELVYDITQKKWFEISRGTGKALNCGFALTDPYGNKFIYGGTTDGYLERLEYGTTFDGNSIVYTFKTGDVPLADSLAYWTELHRLKLIAKSMSTSTANVTLNHYADGSDTATTIDTTDQTDSHRYYQSKHSVSKQAVTHAIECTVTTTNESCGFKPYLLTGQYSVMREDF